MAKKRLKKYVVNADESDVFAISVVDAPAVESEFIALAKEKETLYFKDEEKHMLYGCALRTDFPMYRNSEKYGEYYIEFSKESVEKMARRFMKAGYQNNWTEGHQKEAEGLTVVESWIKTDPYKDKSIALGFGEECAVGSWFVGCYVDSNDIWEKVKNGSYRGFSVEALCSLDELEFNKVENNDTMEVNESFWSRFKSILFDALGKEEKEEVVDEVVNIEENLEEETPQEKPSEEPKVEQPTVEPPVEEKPAEEPNNEVTTDKNEPTEEVKEEPKKEDNHLEDLINNLKAEIEALKEVNSGLQAKVKDLGKTPSTKPVSTNAKPNPKDTYTAWRKQMAEYLR